MLVTEMKDDIVMYDAPNRATYETNCPPGAGRMTISVPDPIFTLIDGYTVKSNPTELVKYVTTWDISVSYHNSAG